MDIKDRRVSRWGGVFVFFSILVVLLDIIRLFAAPLSYRPVLTEAFETVVALAGALACCFAVARSSMLTRGLWALTAAYLSLLAVADFHDFFLEIHFGEATFLSALELVGWCTYVPLALLIFFPPWEEGQLQWKWIPFFDFAQVTLVVALAFFHLIYLPHLPSGQGWAQFGTADQVRNLLISAGLLLRAAAEPYVRTRDFYQRIGGAFTTITLLKIVFPPSYQPVIVIVRPAVLLAIGIFAAYWNDRPDQEIKITRRPIGLRVALSLFAAVTLILIVLLTIGSPTQYRGGMYLIIAVAGILYIVRSYLAENTRYMTEDQLRRSERDYRVLFESAIVPIVIIEPGNDLIIQANPAACELYEFPRGDLISFKPFRKDVASDAKHIAELLETGECHKFQTVHRTRSGRDMDVLVSASVVQYRHQKAILTFCRDITEAKRAEEALRKAEQEYRAIFEQAAVGIAHVGTDGRWLRVNDKLCTLVGYPREELMQLTFQDITHPGDLATDLDYVRQVLSGEINSYSMEKRYIRKDRSLIWANLTVSLVRTGAGEPRFLISVVEDITERKRAEAALHNLGGRLISAQEAERARLAKELHDGLSQNLALLAVELDTLSQQLPNDPAQIDARLRDFSAQTTALATEVRHISHGLHPALLTQLGLAAALKSHCREVAAAHRIEVGFKAQDLPPRLTEDVALSLYRVAQEALQNVVKHSGAKRATVELRAAGTAIELSISDDGKGFEVAGVRTPGSLGLVSMGERIRLVHGEMAVGSKPGQGTRIHVRVPLPKGTTATA